MENKHLRGLDADLKEQIKYNKRTGGPSDALKKLVKRPEVKSKFVFMGDIDPSLKPKGKWGWKPPKK